MDFVNFFKFIIELSECKNNFFKVFNSKIIVFVLKLKCKIYVWIVTFIGYIYCNIAYYVCLVN